MMRRRLSMLLFAMLIVTGCDNDDVTSPVDPPALTTEEQIIADAYVVRDALEAFAADNGGVFAEGGLTNQFFTFLPGGTLLENRYTGLATVPVTQSPQWPGEIGVIFFADESFDLVGYRVVGRGRYDELIRLENVSGVSQEIIDAYDHTLANVDTLLAAVETFAEQAGYYAADCSDGTPTGETLIDLLPGGQLLVNGFSDQATEPQDGVGLGIAGGIGYMGFDQSGDGILDGFLIEAYGLDLHVFAKRTRDSLENEVARSASWLLRSAVEEFASQNSGEYPQDIDTDQTTSGDTVRDLVQGYTLNLFTGTSALRNGLATSRGEVGYVPYEFNGIVVGYVINALGLFNEELERFEVLTN